MGYLLPALEVAVGLGLLLGLLTRASAAVSSLLFVAFVVGIASAWARGLQIDCGCFGGGGFDAFAEMHRIAFENQPPEGGAGPDDDQLVDWAVEAGAEEAEVRPLIEGKAFDQYVVNATDEMSKNGVNGTPTVLIDGEPAGETPQESVAAVLEAVS